MAITANKYRDIRAGLAWKSEIARYIREHNDANILALPARYLDEKEAQEIVQIFLSTPFE
jgi:ribose 5-phosphate isomerase B